MKDRFNHKTEIVIIILVSLLLPVFIISSCSNSKNKAKQYMQKGGNLIEKAMPGIYSLGTKLQWFIINESVNVLNSDISITKNNLEEVIRMTEELIDTANKAKKEYTQISRLKGVDDYSEYANLQIQIIDTASESIKTLNDYLTSLVESISNGSFDSLKIISEQPELEAEFSDLSSEMRLLYDEAKKLKISEKL